MTNNEQNQFKRESRYVVFKVKDLALIGGEDRGQILTTLHHIQDILRSADAPLRQFLVVESDWPEYEPTWRAIEARVTGQPTEQDKAQGVVELLELEVARFDIEPMDCDRWGMNRSPDGTYCNYEEFHDAVQPLFDRVQGENSELTDKVAQLIGAYDEVSDERDALRAEVADWQKRYDEVKACAEKVIVEREQIRAERDEARAEAEQLKVLLKKVLSRGVDWGNDPLPEMIKAELNPPADTPHAE